MQVTIGNQPVQTFCAGLAPGYTGLNQVNVIMPQGVATGNALPVSLGILGRPALLKRCAIQ